MPSMVSADSTTEKRGLSPVAAVFACALFLGLVPGAVSIAVAQHAIDAEKWVEMRKMFREKGPAPTIQEDVAALAGGGARQLTRWSFAGAG